MITHRVSLFVAVVIACAFLLFDRAEATIFERARQAAADALSPVFEVVSGPVSAVRDFLADIQGYLAVHEENARLRMENAELLAAQAQARDLRRRNERFAALLNVQVDPTIEYATGRVVADDGGPFRRTLVVNVGNNDGIGRGQAVVDEHGLVGRIVGTGGHSARILLVTDLNSRVPVYVEPGRRRAILSGDNSDMLRLEYLESDDGLLPGYEVVTTGEGGLIPPGIPVGIVAGELNGIWRVRSQTSFDSIDFVRVLRFDFPQQIEIPPPSLPGQFIGVEVTPSDSEIITTPPATTDDEPARNESDDTNVAQPPSEEG